MKRQPNFRVQLPKMHSSALRIRYTVKLRISLAYKVSGAEAPEQEGKDKDFHRETFQKEYKRLPTPFGKCNNKIPQNYLYRDKDYSVEVGNKTL